ncbi:MAG: pyridoxal phosphate-dependent aminotransferase [Anaerolineae bacterium]|nr:pyridoxal phosphate-dependent aminotransferase [Anaerolineae bacterium]
MNLAQRVQSLKPEGAYAVLAQARALEAEGRDIVHLEIGEPNFDTAEHIRMAAIKALAEGRTHYTPTAGMAELREVIAEDAGRRRGVTFRPSQVVVSPGAKGNLFTPVLAMVEPGDEVIYPNPGYPAYEAAIIIAGATPVPVPVLEENGFSFDLDALDSLISERTKLIIINTPGNPTGGVIPMKDLQHIAEVAKKNDIWVLADEIYSRITYDGVSVPTITTIDGMLERTILVDGYSKTYAMTGWRLGYGIMPEELAGPVTTLVNHSSGCSAEFTQIAGIEAITGQQEWVDEMVAEYQARRDILVDGLNEIPGVSCITPQGAFYVFPNVKSFSKPVGELATQILNEAGVALLPGTAFGKYGEGHLRLSYASSIAAIEEGLERLWKFFSELK